MLAIQCLGWHWNVNYPSKHLLIFQTSWRRLQNAFRVTSFNLLRRLGRRKIVALKTCLEDVLKTCLQDIFKIYLQDVFNIRLQDVFKTSWRQTKCLLGTSVSKKSKSVSDKSIFHISISDKPRRIQNASISTNNYIHLILKLKQHFYIKNWNVWWLFGVVKPAKFKFDIPEQVRQ